MSPVIEKCNKIRHIVRIRQMLQRWRKKAASSSNRVSSGRVPSDVPVGHVAICVGTDCKRFIVRTKYLNHPIFRRLLAQAEEEYGFTNSGPLALPCDESVFEEILRIVSRSESSHSSGRFLDLGEDFQKCCQVNRRTNLDGRSESGPLLGGIADKSSVR